MSKPKEFWLFWKSGSTSGTYRTEPTEDFLRVIEKSSYDDLVRRYEDLSEAYKSFDRPKLEAELEKTRSDLWYLAGFGCDVPSSLYGGMTSIEFMKKIGGAKGAREIVGMEFRCYGEARSILAKVFEEGFQERQKLEEQLKPYLSAQKWVDEVANETIDQLTAERDEYKKLAEAWMADYDRLRAKYELHYLSTGDED